MTDGEVDLLSLQATLGVQIDQELLGLALTHRSFAYELSLIHI